MIDMTRQPERGQISLEKECKWKYIRRTKDVQYILCTFNFHPVFRGRYLSHFLIVFSLCSLWILIASFFLGAQKLQFLADVIHKRSPVWMNFCDLFIFEIYFWVIDLGLILFFLCAFFIFPDSSYRLLFTNTYKNSFWIRSANINFDVLKLYLLFLLRENYFKCRYFHQFLTWVPV